MASPPRSASGAWCGCPGTGRPRTCGPVSAGGLPVRLKPPPWLCQSRRLRLRALALRAGGQGHRQPAQGRRARSGWTRVPAPTGSARLRQGFNEHLAAVLGDVRALPLVQALVTGDQSGFERADWEVHDPHRHQSSGGHLRAEPGADRGRRLLPDPRALGAQPPAGPGPGGAPGRRRWAPCSPPWPMRRWPVSRSRPSAP